MVWFYKETGRLMFENMFSEKGRGNTRKADM